MKRLVIPIMLVIALALPCSGEKTELSHNRLASVRSQPYAPEKADDSTRVSDLPGWLHHLLTCLPNGGADDSTDRELERELEEELEPEVDLAGDFQQPAPEDAEEAPAEVEQAQSPPSVPEPERDTESDGPPWKPADIQPLYSSPKLVGEGIWTAQDLPTAVDGTPLCLKTAYRPSVDYPNSIVYMVVFNMQKIMPRFFVGNSEPGIYQVSYDRRNEDLNRIVAITNAMWMQQHARGAGAIFRSQTVYPMVNGMATLVVYEDNSVDILEWTEDIPVRLVKDARQLRYLIVKDGRVVQEVLKGNSFKDAEIGLGGFLVDNSGNSTMRNKFWFLANRTAFGIREDGNLVFAMAHHCSTKDLARALVLAGCKRAMHGDANIHNIVCNFYFRNDRNKVVKREKLSPEQLKYTMKRYDHGYSKDFFAFYEK